MNIENIFFFHKFSNQNHKKNGKSVRFGWADKHENTNKTKFFRYFGDNGMVMKKFAHIISKCRNLAILYSCT